MITRNTYFLVKISSNFYIRRFLSDGIRNHYDIVIAGGGMVGTTLACTLGNNKKLQGKKILLLEANQQKSWTFNEKYSNRVVSINPGSYQLFNDIGAWDFIKQYRYATVKRLEVSDALSNAAITFGNNQNTDRISYIVENDLIVAAVTERLKDFKNIEVLYNAKVQQYKLPDYEENLVNINLTNGNSYSCDLLLGCDGVKSLVRNTMEADYLTWNYDQVGIVATLKLCEEIQNDIAWQKFLPTGPIALLPLNKNHSSLVWSTSHKEAKRLLELPETDFVDEVNKAVLGEYSSVNRFVHEATMALDRFIRMSNCQVESTWQQPPKVLEIETASRAAFPLGFGHSSQYIRKGVVLVGDAAHRVHPLAGQGVNLGFGDIACLNKVLGEAAYSGSPINNLMFLKHYETERQQHNIPTMMAIEGLHRLYTTEAMPVVLLRSLGLQLTNATEPLKKLLISHAAS